MRIGVLASHPIQYHAPWFRALAKKSDLHVYFAHRVSAAEQAEAGFGVAFEWDVDLLSGYQHQFLDNVSPAPSVNRFAGCDTPQIADIVSRERFDGFIVCGWYLKSFLQAARACRRAGVPVLVRGDSQLHTPRSFFKRVSKQLTHRVLLQQFDGFLYVGERNADYLRHYGVHAEQMFFVPNFVDTVWFAAAAESQRHARQSMRERWGVGEAQCAALFVGKFIWQKRPLDLLDALSQLPRHGFMAVYAGSGPLEPDLRERAKRDRLHVSFEGFQNQSRLPGYYASADVLVLPSESETWGLVVNEAMACSLPAIVADSVGCAPDLIDEGLTGFTFPAGDTAALAAVLQRVAARKREGYDWAPHLKAKSRQYDVDRAVTGTLEAISTIRQRRAIGAA